MAKAQQKVIVIIARRWFQKGPGNTYHSVHVIDMRGKEPIEHVAPFAYGYGDQYEETACGLLGIKCGQQPFWQWCQDNGIKRIVDIADVTSRKELHNGGES